MREAVSCADDLRTIEIFADLAEDELEWLLGEATCVDVEAGETIWTAGQPADAMYVLLRGTVHLNLDLAGQPMVIEPHRLGGVFGLLPFSRMKEFVGRNVAAEATRLLRIDKETFPAMLNRIPELGERLVALMADRIRGGAIAQQQREKMIALGKLSAGLAHELNNPAAAMRRDAAELKQRLARSNALVLRLAEHALSPDQMRAVVELRNSSAGGSSSPELSPLERGEREDLLGEWLEEQGVEDGWVLAEALVDAGLSIDDIREVCDRLPPAAIPDALAWIESGIAASQILTQVGAAASRISDLVTSVKSYSHMDQNPAKQPADLREGLETTLRILAHKLKKKSVRLERSFAQQLGQVPAYVSELNQVWTNLLDNAIDAVAEGGSIEVATGQSGEWAEITITDDGMGIPEEIQPRIFEPFFTTKAVGDGTGLGLDVVQRIAIQHGGEVTFESEPGRTAFIVRLPLADAAFQA